MNKRRWVVSLAAGGSIMGVAATTGLVMLARLFVEEFSRPHIVVDSTLFPWKMPESLAEPPATLQRTLLFHTRDGKLLHGEFWAQPQPAPTVIICHGYRVSGATLRPVATLEYNSGYNILLFDFRGHGDSESVNTSGGNAEVHDLEAAIAVAIRQAETLPGKILLHGFSMGAAIALLTPPHPDVAAIIADSPYAHLDAILRSFVHWQLMEKANSWSPSLRWTKSMFSALSWGTVVTSGFVYRLRFGQALMAHPAGSMKRWQGYLRKSRDFHIPPILLIHGTEDNFIPITHSYQIVKQARMHNIPLETYFAEGSNHCSAYGDDPEKYVATMRNFVAQYLGDAYPDVLTS
ncbi:MAG TPA: alpha/beta fold hydrolase [Ktedonobacteraceae bacterium]|nr:alpha/beta fold hydrolase [Ktedonobacteraceae bacterium]